MSEAAANERITKLLEGVRVLIEITRRVPMPVESTEDPVHTHANCYNIGQAITEYLEEGKVPEIEIPPTASMAAALEIESRTMQPASENELK